MRLDYMKQISLLKELVASRDVAEQQKYLAVDFF